MTRTSSCLLGSGIAVCHGYPPRIGARPLRLSTPSLSTRSFKPSKAFHMPPRSAPYIQRLRHSLKILPQGFLFWTLLTGTGITYSVFNAKPLVLEGERVAITSEEVERKYSSSTISMTIEQANGALEQMGETFMIGNGSGVIRHDDIQLPSNPIVEDWCNWASGVEENGVGWMMFGIYDGHA